MADQLGRRTGPGGRLAVLSEESEQTSGSDARAATMVAGKAITETVRTTLGPKGMDKMLVDSIGEILVTNDGAIILRKMDLDHPAADLFVDVATTQDEEVRDGTTTATVLAGAFLQQAEELLEQGLHPTMITKGYRQAATEAVETLESMAIDADLDDKELLSQLATTAMTGKATDNDREHLADSLSRSSRPSPTRSASTPGP